MNGSELRILSLFIRRDLGSLWHSFSYMTLKKLGVSNNMYKSQHPRPLNVWILTCLAMQNKKSHPQLPDQVRYNLMTQGMLPDQ